MAQETTEVIPKTYLGDGAYARLGSYQGEVVVYTFNGFTEDNHVYLEAPAVIQLVEFLRQQGWKV